MPASPLDKLESPACEHHCNVAAGALDSIEVQIQDAQHTKEAAIEAGSANINLARLKSATCTYSYAVMECKPVLQYLFRLQCLLTATTHGFKGAYQNGTKTVDRLSCSPAVTKQGLHTVLQMRAAYLDFPVLADQQVGRLEVSVQNWGLAFVQVQHAFGSIQRHVQTPHPIKRLWTLQQQDADQAFCEHKLDVKAIY